MKKQIFNIALCMLAISCSNKEESVADIEYFVQANLKDSIPNVQVEFDYDSDTNGLIVLRYENNSWGDDDIFNCIKELEVVPKPQDVRFLRDSSQIIIKTKSNINNTIRYQISQDYKGLPMNQKRYRPIVDSTYFHALGMRLFAVPEPVFESDTSKAKIRINYSTKTNNGIFHSSFGKDAIQNIEVVREDLYASFFVGGNYRRYSFVNGKDTVYFISRGNWKPFTDQQIFEILKKTMSFQKEFWNDPRGGDFSVSLVPTFESWYSVGGSGFSSSFISFASNNDNVTLGHMRWLYNHELLHKWIGRTILNENEVEQYWFSEGFTDYYSYKLQLKYNQLDVAEYLNIINNDVLIPHYQDPLNRVPNSKLTLEEYWGNYSKYQKLPYRRGLLYAFLIDNQIKKESNYTKSLDNLMQELFEQALKDQNMRLNQSTFLSTLSKYLNHSNIKSDFEKYIIKGELIDFQNQVPNEIFIEFQGDIPLLKFDLDSAIELRRKLKL